MKTRVALTVLFAIIGIAVLLNGCEKKGCPEGMHEQTISGGGKICVPDHLR